MVPQLIVVDAKGADVPVSASETPTSEEETKFRCSCGRSSQVSPKLVGKRLKCPTCNDWFVVSTNPAAEPAITLSAAESVAPPSVPSILLESRPNSLPPDILPGDDDQLSWLNDGGSSPELGSPLDLLSAFPEFPELPSSSYSGLPSAVPFKSNATSKLQRDVHPDQREKKPNRSALIAAGSTFVFLVTLVIGFASYRISTSAPSSSSALSNQATAQTTPSVVSNPLIGLARKLKLNQAEREKLTIDIRRIEGELQLSEIRSETVYQQQVGRVYACIEMTAVVAHCLGASTAETAAIQSQIRTNEILADTVHQQLAGHLSGYFDMVTLAAENAGVESSSISAVEAKMNLEDALARTAQQQISARLQGIFQMSELLALGLGADGSKLSSIEATVSLDDSRSDTVFQQMSARQAGIVNMLAAAAVASGADSSAVTSIQSAVSSDDIRTETVQQQLSARLQRTFEMTLELARAIVLK